MHYCTPTQERGIHARPGGKVKSPDSSPSKKVLTHLLNGLTLSYVNRIGLELYVLAFREF